MSARELVSRTFEELVEQGRAILRECGWDGSQFSRSPREEDYVRLRARGLNLIQRVFSEQSEHYRELDRLAQARETSRNSYFLAQCLGIIEAARLDFEAGLLFDLRTLVRAELLDDFLDQAEHPLAEGYYASFALLAGAILEDTLRRLCGRRGLSVPEKASIDRLNAELAKVSAYDKLVRKKIAALADIRNNADHGHLDKFSGEDVQNMVKWVRRFAVEYLR